ncbi:MAG: hypothetical protein GY934_09335, partial [Gammaproteobacteria bacterium]|nr:hypothetical protein [Gammaproteobacteria bacterium]
LNLIIIWWIACLSLLWLWKKDLFTKTWQEPYFHESLILIESDDWGPGAEFHADRLQGLLECLVQHKDSTGRNAILTADVVLAVPDTVAISNSSPPSYHRRLLDSEFPNIYKAMKEGIRHETLVPQLHGLEHLNGAAFTACHTVQDPRVDQAFADTGWWDWETLDSPLQGHYVDGSHLPTTPIAPETARDIISMAAKTFERMFGQPSQSTVAPCYLWNYEIEQIWNEQSVSYIQTAGYRCTARDAAGKYLQDKSLIRPGDQSDAEQRYLVRNVMYEPVDGVNTPDTAFKEVIAAHRQALPITISTHRYNYTRGEDEFNHSISGLDQLLTRIGKALPHLRFLSSPELGASMESPLEPILNPFSGTEWPPV